MSGINAISAATTTGEAMSPERQQKLRQLRKTVNEVVGVTFFAPVLKSAHNSVLKGKYGHGGRGEDIFQGQMDLELARSMGGSVGNNLTEAMFKSFARHVR